MNPQELHNRIKLVQGLLPPHYSVALYENHNYDQGWVKDHLERNSPYRLSFSRTSPYYEAVGTAHGETWGDLLRNAQDFAINLQAQLHNDNVHAICMEILANYAKHRECTRANLTKFGDYWLGQCLTDALALANQVSRDGPYEIKDTANPNGGPAEAWEDEL